MKLYIFMIGLYVRMIYCYRAFRDINKLKLGDVVIYEGERWHTYQGAGDPFWKIVQWYENAPHTKTVNRDYLQMQPLWKRFGFSFMHTYRFYMRYWYQIDVSNRGRFIFSGLKQGHP